MERAGRRGSAKGQEVMTPRRQYSGPPQLWRSSSCTSTQPFANIQTGVSSAGYITALLCCVCCALFSKTQDGAATRLCNRCTCASRMSSWPSALVLISTPTLATVFSKHVSSCVYTVSCTCFTIYFWLQRLQSQFSCWRNRKQTKDTVNYFKLVG